jgi:hypothetical protein
MRGLVLAALSALALCAGCFTKEAPREVSPAPREPSAPAPPSAAPATAPPPSPPPPPSASDGDFDFALPPAEPAPSTPAARPEEAKPKSDLRPRRAAPARPEGSAAPKAATESKRELESGDDVARANALIAQLRSTRSVPAADCPGARAQRDTICALAARICRLVERDPNVASIADYCAEARQRCVDAGRRTAERCD